MSRCLRTALLLAHLLALAGPALCAAAAPAGQRAVLVAAQDAQIPLFSPTELRQLFLGLPHFHQGQRIKALRNLSDPLLHEIFLQKVVFMSAHNYERHLLSRVFRIGGQRPPAYTSRDELITALHVIPHSLTYMWEQDIQGVEGLKVLQILWQE